MNGVLRKIASKEKEKKMKMRVISGYQNHNSILWTAERIYQYIAFTQGPTTRCTTLLT